MITVLQVLEATEGGTRRHLRDLVSALDPCEFRLALALSYVRDPSVRDEDLAQFVSCGVPVFEVVMRREIAPFADALSLLRLVRCVRRVRPDLIHAHSSKAGFLARLAGAWCRVPVVYTPHAFPFLMTTGKQRRFFYRLLERFARGMTAALIAVTEEEVREALKIGYARGQVTLIQNGVAACDAAPVRVREVGVRKVGFFGRLTRQKGPELLIDAASEIVAHVPNVSFNLYGGGEMKEALQAQVGERQLASHVTFEGECHLDETVALMRELDVVVVPSRWEGCPYVVLEAFQAGVPVVAAAVGGVPELIRNEVNGVLVEAGNPEALCDAVLSLLRDPTKRQRLAEQGRRTAASHTLGEMATAIGNVYRKAALRR
jgi:glycosyltransferase involved in cell wall biosynthesis